jgi:LemA protein
MRSIRVRRARSARAWREAASDAWRAGAAPASIRAMPVSLLVIVAIIIALLVWVMLVFNRLIRDRNRVSQSWSDVDVQLQRRHELVPRLVELVKGYSGHEKALLTSLADLRSRGAQANPAKRGDLEQSVHEGVRQLVALVEAYPELKAGENFQQLHEELVDTENQIQYARRYYNGAVNLYNNRIQKFPDLIIAGSFNFKPALYFQRDDDARATVPAVAL